MGGATRCGRSAGTAWLFDGDLETRGNTIYHLDGDLRNGYVAWSTVADVARPPRAVSSAWRRERGGGPAAGVARPPRIVSSQW